LENLSCHGAAYVARNEERSGAAEQFTKKALQDVFGYINDVRTAPRLVEIQQERQGGSHAARAASNALAHHNATAHAWRRAGKALAEIRALATVFLLNGCDPPRKSAGAGGRSAAERCQSEATPSASTRCYPVSGDGAMTVNAQLTKEKGPRGSGGKGDSPRQ
jgi:hypothetical protein